ncbi:MAG: class I SAM-dependent methyltransferase [Euryarchaeota archaeon]|nr:class I SAM-dependent methyltransferase [Euryarchaeota archaeon]
MPDVGCGTGVLSLLSSEIGHNITGIDLPDGMLGRAKEKADDWNLSAEFKIDDAENLSFEDGSFDSVINRHLLSDAAGPKKSGIRVETRLETRWQGGHNR